MLVLHSPNVKIDLLTLGKVASCTLSCLHSCLAYEFLCNWLLCIFNAMDNTEKYMQLYSLTNSFFLCLTVLLKSILKKYTQTSFFFFFSTLV